MAGSRSASLSDAETRQADLEREFPGVGVVAVQMDRTKAELEALQQRVQQHLIAHFPVSTYGLIDHGVVGVGLGVLSDERLALLEDGICRRADLRRGSGPRRRSEARTTGGHR